MWEEEAEGRSLANKKVYFAAGIGIILLLIAGFIFLFPFGFVSQPQLAFSKRQPSVVASKTYVNPGELLALSGDSQGFWRIWQQDGQLTVNRFGPTGETEWVADYNVDQPLVDVNGRKVIVADGSSGKIYIIEEGKGLIHTQNIDGRIEAVAIAETGQWAATYFPHEASPEAVDALLTFFGPGGEELFSSSFVNMFPFGAKLNQNGTQGFFTVGKITPEGLENHLLSYADTGQLLWTAQLPAGPPLDMAMKTFADRVAIAVDKTIVSYNNSGQPLWQHFAQGAIWDLDFMGQSDQLIYSSQKLSIFSFKKQALITSLDGEGGALWQYEIKGTVPRISGGSTSLMASVTNNLGIHSIGSDGQVRWSQRYAAGEGGLGSSQLTGGVASGDGGTVLVQLNDGRMFVLRGE